MKNQLLQFVAGDPLVAALLTVMLSFAFGALLLFIRYRLQIRQRRRDGLTPR